jgi:GTP-binding protein Era
LNKKCGYVAVLGETNAGKSTLINQMVGQKVSIVSRKIQTTLSRTLGIAIYENSQIIFIDTPGFLRSNTKSAESLSKIAWDAFRETENILFVIDVNKKNFDESLALLKKIDTGKKVSLVMNKVDLIHKPELLKIAAIFNEVRNFEKIFMVSGISGSGVKDIVKYLAEIVPQGDWIYAQDEVTDSSFEKYTSEITREHVYHRLHKEIPYKCKVETESYEDQKDGSIKIVQNIHVKSNAHKVICLGHKGGKIKAIGEAARKELSELLERNVHLFLHVLVDEK